MTPFNATQGVQQVYDFWLGLIPQFLGQAGAAKTSTEAGANGAFNANDPAALLNGLVFPADQIAKAAAMTQQSLQAVAQVFAPLLNAAAPAGNAANPTQAMFAPWSALLSNLAGASSAPAQAGAASVLPLQAMSQAWLDLGSRLAGVTPAQFTSAFERTYGGLSDAFGLAPVREIYAAWQDMLAAGITHQEARANYAALLQQAFMQGVQRLAKRLATKADAGERIDSVLAFLRQWAMATEEVVHETLQSEPGLAATAALTRSASTYRKRMREVSTIVAGVFDLTTRRELDEAYREIQALKREVRASRRENARSPARAVREPAAAAARKRASGKKK
jgi:hypothetical protein